MAEETITTQSLGEISDSASSAANAFNLLGSMTDSVRNQLTSFNEKVSNVKNNFDQNQRTLENQTNAFGLLSVAVLGVRKSFDNLSGIDTTQLSTFAGQIQDIQQIILKDSSLGDMAKKAEALGKALHVPTDIIGKGIVAVINYTNSLAESADNALRLQNAYLQLGARTGTLNDIYAAAGPNLGNINLLLERQQKLITDTAAATGAPIATIEQYYAQLGTIPKALNDVVTGSEGTGSTISMLAGTMQLAAGSGRKYADVVEDLRTAFKDYNISGDAALTFTARMGELSNRFGVELDDVRTALRSTANDFKMFGNEAEGAASLMNQYLGALKNTGISGTVAVDVVRNMTGQLKDLTIAQKGFLSAQTGGSGGLMGAFQIEKELREGKIDKVFERVRQTMSKQFGNIVSLEEASQSQQAAAQLTKQMMVLRQGPLGQFARSDQEAIRILESFKATNAGKPTPALSENITEDVMKVGVDINKKSYTELSRIRSLIETARGAATTANLGFVQDSFAAGTGQRNVEVDTETGANMRDNLDRAMIRAGNASAETAGTAAQSVAGGTLLNKSGQSVFELTENLREFTSQVVDSAKAPVENMSRLINQNMSAERAAADNKKQFMSDIAASNAENFSRGAVPDGSGSVLVSSPIAQLGGAATQAANVATKIQQRPDTVTAQTSIEPSSAEANGQIKVQVEGFCLDCGDRIKGSNQSFSVNTAQRAKK